MDINLCEIEQERLLQLLQILDVDEYLNIGMIIFTYIVMK